MEQCYTNELILTIVDNGHFNQVMEAAKSAGATGGTLIHARGLGTEEAIKYLGITITPEKDIVMIVLLFKSDSIISPCGFTPSKN